MNKKPYVHIANERIYKQAIQKTVNNKRSQKKGKKKTPSQKTLQY